MSGRFRTDTVSYTDVVAHNALLVAETVFALVPLVAYQYQSAIIVVTVIVLYDGIGTIIIAVVGLCIPRCLMSAYVVELNCSVVATPWPETGCGFGHGEYIRTVAHHVVFYKCAVASYGNNPVSRYFFDEIAAYYCMFAGKPVTAVVVSGPYYGIAGTTHDVAVFDDETVKAGTYLFTFVYNIDAASSTQLFYWRSVDIADGNSVNANVVGNAIVLALYF